MSKANTTYPKGYKKKDVSLDTMERPDANNAPVRVLYMADGTVWEEVGPGTFNQRKPVVNEEGQADANIVDELKASADNNELVSKAAEHIEAQNAKIAELEAKIAAKDAENAKAGKPARTMEDVTVAKGPMAGKYPAKTDDMPTVDEINGTA